MKIRIWDSI